MSFGPLANMWAHGDMKMEPPLICITLIGRMVASQRQYLNVNERCYIDMCYGTSTPDSRQGQSRRLSDLSLLVPNTRFVAFSHQTPSKPPQQP
jgi:hypothetical protein